jgi:GNAT superfamily N-acetyltransferase
MLFGRYQITAYERPTSIPDARVDRAMRFATIDDLERLEGLLAPGHDHAARIAAGSVCVWAETPNGDAAGLQWVNVDGHPDAHFGDLSRPADGVAYLNQIVVDDRFRIRGYAPRIMIASVAVAGERGFTRARGLVARQNKVMHTLLAGLDFQATAVQRGVRIGAKVTLRNTKQHPSG